MNWESAVLRKKKREREEEGIIQTLWPSSVLPEIEL